MPNLDSRLFENAYDVTVVTGADGRITFVTPSITRVLGYDPKEVVGTSGIDFLSIDDLPDALAVEAEALRDPSATPTLEVRARHRDGSVRWLEFVLTNRLDDPEIRGVVANIRDISRRKEVEHRLESLNKELKERNEQLDAANVVKDRFVATASHEVRAPVTVIIGAAQTLRFAWDTLSDDEKRSFVAKIEHRGQQLAAMVDDLLVLAQAEGSPTVSGAACQVEAAIQEAIDTSGPASRVELSCPPDLRARADPRRVSQILVNYLTNAFRYGAPPFVVDARSDGTWVDIAVRDQGPGVSPEFVCDLFEPFTQSRSAREVSTVGTGLGLSIVRELAQAEGGQAWYEANRPRGSCFVVRLPA